MRILSLLLFVSLSGLIAALMLPGLGDYVLLAGPCVLACIILLFRKWRDAPPTDRTEPRERGFRRPRNATAPWLLIDGSNVLYWKDNTPQIATLREVIARVTTLGYLPGVVFDANAGYLISGKYQHDKALGDLLGLPEDRVMVVQKGEPADPVLLAAARDLGARIVTNDRYRDWAETNPEVRNPGFLIQGSYRDGTLWLDLNELAVA